MMTIGELRDFVEDNRIEIYKMVISSMEEEEDYICLSLRRHTNILIRRILRKRGSLYYFGLNQVIKECFPEFYKLKELYTENKKTSELKSCGWFGYLGSPGTKEKRLEVLNNILKELEDGRA